MSLWDKWEREALRKKGVRVQEPRNVEIHSSYTKPDIRKQVSIVLVTGIGCLLLVLAAMLIETLATGKRWSDTYIVQLFATMQRERERMAAENR